MRALQEEHGLSVTGNVDDATWKLLGGLSAPSAGGTLKAGDRGKRVVKLQNRLLLHGYNPGGSDGIYGAATAEAVRKLQAEEKTGKDRNGRYQCVGTFGKCAKIYGEV